MDGYDVFPDDYDYAAKAFKAANTNFSPYYSEKILVEPGIATVADIYEFVEDNAECYLDEDLQCVRIDSTLKKLEHKLYLASMKSFPSSGTLGGTLNDGIEYQAICFIFVENIKNFANQVKMSPSSLTEGAVVHELGHGRANLQHLCSGPYTMDNTNHAQITCIMTNRFPKPECADDDDKPTLYYGPQFCDSCIVNLKDVNW